MPKSSFFYVRSFYKTTEKTLFSKKKTFFLCSVLQTTIVTFCATCTITRYPCFAFNFDRDLARDQIIGIELVPTKVIAI